MNERQWASATLGLVGAIVLWACAPSAGSASKNFGLNPQGVLSNGAASAVKGSITVTPDGAKTKIAVSMSGLEPNSTHAGHVHIGTCSAVGPVAVLLSAVKADASGNGSATTDVDSAKLSGSVYVAYHQRGPDDANGIGAFITCGEIN